ncbi:MAG: cyclase family protein [Erysipelotrichaceae bacterium]|nr:cyclase family protein [Erysipelotrichaceae bacterium]
MKTDLTLKLNPEMLKTATGQNRSLFGHLGTHFDVMNREFPLEYTELPGIVFDIEGIVDRDIGVTDIALDRVKAGMFVLFHTGFLEKEGYGTPVYSHQHPQLSPQLIEKLIERKIALIGVDCAGIRRGREHTPADQLCADNNVFVIENLCSLKDLAGKNNLLIHTYPMNCSGISGLPCRVIAEHFD